jgi:3-deoxy-D-manno-octulosonic-acid transferase
VQRVEITGSIKFDVVVPEAALAIGAALRAAIGPRPVLLCASTREGEEEPILQAFENARTALPANVLLLIVPRHPQRFDEVEKMIAARGLNVQRRSKLPLDGSVLQADVLLGDSMGEMFAYYAASDCAFIGGSLLPLGGQNLIEACALGKPVLIGEHTFNFAQASDEAVAAGAAQRVRDADHMLELAAGLLRDGAARAAMGRRAAGFADRHRGATARTVELLQPLIH